MRDPRLMFFLGNVSKCLDTSGFNAEDSVQPSDVLKGHYTNFTLGYKFIHHRECSSAWAYSCVLFSVVMGRVSIFALD